MTTLPQQKTWSQVTDRDSFNPLEFGSILASMCLDLSTNKGRIRISPRMLLNVSTDDVAELTSFPVGFWLCGGEIHTIAGTNAGGYAFKTPGVLMNASFVKETAGTEPTTIDSSLSDGVFSNNALYVTGPDTVGSLFASVWKKVGSLDWTKFSTSADSLFPMMLFHFQGRTYMTTTQSKIISWDASDTIAYSGANTIVLNGISGDFSNVITRPLVGSDRVWILCLNTTGERGFIYEWDGAATTHSRKHILHSAGAVAGCIYHDVPYIMDTNGNVQYWNGSTFKTVASLPFKKKKKRSLYNAISLYNNRFVHPNGMNVVDEKILINVDTRNYDSDSSIEDTIPSGVYEFDPNNPARGLVHKHSYGLSKEGGTIKDYGQERIYGVGGISEMNIPSTDGTKNGTFLAGASVYKNASSVVHGIFFDDTKDTLQKAGSFVTLKFDATSLKDAFQFMNLVFSKLKVATDKIVAKFRTEDEDSVTASITWTGDNTFTVLNSDIDVSEYYTEGNDKSFEVEIIQGNGSNVCAHITDAVNNAGTWTVTLDQSISGATGTAKARFQKWNWLFEANYDDGLTTKGGKPEGKAAWIQFKVWAILTGPTDIEKLVTDEETILPTVKKS